MNSVASQRHRGSRQKPDDVSRSFLWPAQIAAHEYGLRQRYQRKRDQRLERQMRAELPTPVAVEDGRSQMREMPSPAGWEMLARSRGRGDAGTGCSSAGPGGCGAPGQGGGGGSGALRSNHEPNTRDDREWGLPPWGPPIYDRLPALPHPLDDTPRLPRDWIWDRIPRLPRRTPYDPDPGDRSVTDDGGPANLAPCAGLGLGPPPVSDLSPETIRCLAELGAVDAWPETDCCEPSATQQHCDLPDGSSVQVELRPPELNLKEGTYRLLEPTWESLIQVGETIELIQAAMALLRENMDIVAWLACLTSEFGDLDSDVDLVECLDELIMGRAPMHYTLIGAYLKDDGSDGSAMGTAFTYERPARDPDGSESVGVILPIDKYHWRLWTQNYQAGGGDAFCSVVAAAAILLHEIVHICVQDRGGNHPAEANQEDAPPPDPLPCWDEAGIMGTGFLWAVTQRFPCLTEPGSCCAVFADPTYFLYGSYWGYDVGVWGC